MSVLINQYKIFLFFLNTNKLILVFGKKILNIRFDRFEHCIYYKYNNNNTIILLHDVDLSKFNWIKQDKALNSEVK